MKTIYKYPLEIMDLQFILTHKHAKVITVQFQDGLPYIWMQVDTSQPMEDKPIRIFGTGHQIYNDNVYVSTIQHNAMVWHIYEII